MEFGLTFEKLLVIGVLAAVIIGPERLPKVAEGFARFVRRAGEYMRDTKSRMRDELGPEMDDVDWRKLDPRQYDPRRIIRDALFEEPSAKGAAAAAAGATAAGVMASDAATATTEHVKPQSMRMRPAFTRETPPPFDIEAT